YLAAGDQPAALVAAVRAAEAAAAVYAHGEAARLFERALELWPRVDGAAALTGREHFELLAEAAQAHDSDAQRVRAAALFEAAADGVAACDDQHRAAGLLERLAAARWGLGTAERGLATLERGLALLPADDVSREHALLLARRASFLMLRGRHR